MVSKTDEHHTVLVETDLREHTWHDLACTEDSFGGAVVICVTCGVMIAYTEVESDDDASQT